MPSRDTGSYRRGGETRGIWRECTKGSRRDMPLVTVCSGLCFFVRAQCRRRRLTGCDSVDFAGQVFIQQHGLHFLRTGNFQNTYNRSMLTCCCRPRRCPISCMHCRPPLAEVVLPSCMEPGFRYRSSARGQTFNKNLRRQFKETHFFTTEGSTRASPATHRRSRDIRTA